MQRLPIYRILKAFIWDQTWQKHHSSLLSKYFKTFVTICCKYSSVQLYRSHTKNYAKILNVFCLFVECGCKNFIVKNHQFTCNILLPKRGEVIRGRVGLDHPLSETNHVHSWCQGPSQAFVGQAGDRTAPYLQHFNSCRLGQCTLYMDYWGQI